MGKLIEVPVFSFSSFDDAKSISKKVAFDVDFVAKIETWDLPLVNQSYVIITFKDHSSIKTDLTYDEILALMASDR